MKLEEIQIRETSVNDFADIMEVEKTAFGYDKEAELVADLLKDPSAEPRLSLLARYNGKAVGHILFTKVEIEGAAIQPLIHILAPLAVIPDFQKQGIGGLLIRKGIQMLKEKGTKLVFVLGHKEYYPPTWFHTKRPRYGLSHTIPIPDTRRICRILDDTGADR